jgi:hypothetical protein
MYDRKNVKITYHAMIAENMDNVFQNEQVLPPGK